MEHIVPLLFMGVYVFRLLCVSVCVYVCVRMWAQCWALVMFFVWFLGKCFAFHCCSLLLHLASCYIRDFSFVCHILCAPMKKTTRISRLMQQLSKWMRWNETNMFLFFSVIAVAVVVVVWWLSRINANKIKNISNRTSKTSLIIMWWWWDTPL